MSTFATPGPIAATVSVAGAQVRVNASDRADTVVLVEPIDRASRSDVKVADRTKVEFAAGRLSVKTTVAGDKTGSIAITIDLPAGSGLVANLAHSGLQADGPLGEFKLHMASSRVQLDRIESVAANVSTGEVVISHIAGSASIDGGTCDLDIGEVVGTVGLVKSGGRVRIGHALADLDLSASSCNFDIDRADGSVTATTSSGAIRIGRMTSGQAKLMNGSGNIELGIGEGAAASIDADSKLGAVHDFVSSQGTTDPSNHKVMVFARTRHGDIIIQRAAA